VREIALEVVGWTENEVAQQILNAAYQVHTSLGPGLLESVYEVVRIEMGFRADLIVEDSVIVEIQAVESVARGGGR
jgi:PD-(D/E)XK nuclease superfamily protein